MLDLSASDMDLGTVRPVSHVKVADAAEVQSKFYKFGPLLGRGAYGTVMLGTERSTGDKWAIKILNKAQCGQHQLALFQREIRILRAVRHPHIIHLERVLESPSALFLVLELCLGELADFAKKKKCFSENEARRVVQCLASAVSYLHSKDIVHRDLKLENLLVAANPMDANDKLYIKVTDFGLSVVRGGFGQENMLQEQCGTPAYMAPELFGSRMYSQQCDIWAMGVIMYVMLTGKFPFEPRGNKTLPMVVSTEDPDMSGPAFKGEDKEPLKKILKKMLEKNPAYRANAHDVEMDPWTRNAAEEAPSENVMELMRMWRKDMRTPSLGTGAGAGAFSESGQGQRRGSRNSVILDNIRPPISSTPNKPGGGGARRKGNYGRPPPETTVRTAARNLAPETTKPERLSEAVRIVVRQSEGKSYRVIKFHRKPVLRERVPPMKHKPLPRGAAKKIKNSVLMKKNMAFIEAPSPVGNFSMKNRPELVQAIMRCPARNSTKIPRGLVLRNSTTLSEEDGTTINLLPTSYAPAVVFIDSEIKQMKLQSEYQESQFTPKSDPPSGGIKTSNQAWSRRNHASLVHAHLAGDRLHHGNFSAPPSRHHPDTSKDPIDQSNDYELPKSAPVGPSSRRTE